MNSESHVELDRVWMLLKKKWLSTSLIILAGCLLGLLTGFSQKEVYQAEGSLLIKRKSNASSLTGVGESITDLDPLYQDSVPLETEAEIITSIPVIKLAIESGNLQQIIVEEDTSETILENLDVSQVNSSDMLRITYTGDGPRQVAKVVNSILAAYMQNNIQNNQKDTASAKEFIENQLPYAETNLRRSELAIQKFKEQHPFVDIQQKDQTVLNSITQIQDEITDAELVALKAQNEVTALLRQIGSNDKQALALTALNQSQGVQDILRELQTIQSQRAIAQNSFQPSHPVMLDLADREQTLKKVLKKRSQLVLGSRSEKRQNELIQSGQLQQDTTAKIVELRAQQVSATKQAAALKKLLQNSKKQAKALPKLQRTLEELGRKREAAQLTYSSLIEKLEELRVAEDQNAVNARVVSPAIIPDDPANPSKFLFMIIGGFFGGILALANVLIAEANDKSLKTIEDAQRIFGYRLLSIIPIDPIHNNLKTEFGSIPKLYIEKEVDSKICHSFLFLHANFMALDTEKNCQVVGITSAILGEGKSTVAANFAKVLAQSGKQTLLIDADLCHAVQHEIWGLKNSRGLWQYLQFPQMGEEAKYQSVGPNLQILTAGSTSIQSSLQENTNCLDSLANLEYLLEILRPRYDYIIIDSPDLTSNSVMTAVQKAIDGIMLVVKPGFVEFESAILARNFLALNSYKVLGTIINGVSVGEQTFSQYFKQDHSFSEMNFERQLQVLLSGEMLPPLSHTHNTVYQNHSLNQVSALQRQETIHQDNSATLNRVSFNQLQNWISEQEQELMMRRKGIDDLQEKFLNCHYPDEKIILKSRITEEEEFTSLLEESIEGQRRQLRAKLASGRTPSAFS